MVQRGAPILRDLVSPRSAKPPPAPPVRPQSARQPFDRAMWLERTRCAREAEFVQSNLHELQKVMPLMSPRHRQLRMRYDTALAAKHAMTAGGACFAASAVS